MILDKPDGGPDMAKLSHEIFFTRAITKVALSNRIGVRLDILREPFAEYYGKKADLSKALDTLIKQGIVVAVHLTWFDKGNQRNTIDQARRLMSFPDPNVKCKNPILYLPHKLPKILRKRINRPNEILDMILKADK